MTEMRSIDLRREDGIIIGMLVRLLVMLALLGLAGYEGAMILSAKLSATRIGDEVALRGAAVFAETGSTDKARAAAEKEAKSEEASLESFTVDRDRNRVRVVVEKQADTLIVHRVGPGKDLTLARSTEEAPLP